MKWHQKSVKGGRRGALDDEGINPLVKVRDGWVVWVYDADMIHLSYERLIGK